MALTISGISNYCLIKPPSTFQLILRIEGGFLNKSALIEQTMANKC